MPDWKKGKLFRSGDARHSRYDRRLHIDVVHQTYGRCTPASKDTTDGIFKQADQGTKKILEVQQRRTITGKQFSTRHSLANNDIHHKNTIELTLRLNGGTSKGTTATSMETTGGRMTSIGSKGWHRCCKRGQHNRESPSRHGKTGELTPRRYCSVILDGDES